MASFFKQCKEMLTKTTSELEEHIQKSDSGRQNPSSQGARTLDEDEIEREKVQEEKDSIRQCLTICAQASEQVDKVHISMFKDVSAAQDADQAIIATLGDLISVKRATAGVGAT